MIKIDEKAIKGEINFSEKVEGRGVVNSQSWLLSSTSTSLILEIAEDPEIQPQDLPLVGYGCGGWMYQQKLASNKDEVIAMVNEGFKQFKTNQLEYVPAVTCACQG